MNNHNVYRIMDLHISIMVLYFSIMDLQETIIEQHDWIYGFPSIYLCSSILAGSP